MTPLMQLCQVAREIPALIDRSLIRRSCRKIYLPFTFSSGICREKSSGRTNAPYKSTKIRFDRRSIHTGAISKQLQ